MSIDLDRLPTDPIAFAALDIRRGLHQLEERREMKEEQYRYVNGRAEMYGELSDLLDPALRGLSLAGGLGGGFAIPLACGYDPGNPTRKGIQGQLIRIPKWYDEEGRLYLPKKNRKPGEERNESRADATGARGESRGCPGLRRQAGTREGEPFLESGDGTGQSAWGEFGRVREE